MIKLEWENPQEDGFRGVIVVKNPHKVHLHHMTVKKYMAEVITIHTINLVIRKYINITQYLVMMMYLTFQSLQQ